MLVHVPMALVALLPPAIAVALMLHWQGTLPRRGWWGITAGFALLAASSLVALKTGQNEEDRVEQVVAESAIETHEERAELFAWLAAAAFVLSMLPPLAAAPMLRGALGAGALVVSLGLAGLGILVGHSGGSLVYEHGAAAAYAPAGAGGSPSAALDDRGRSHGGDDDRD
jgi:hypothetical protein